MINITLSNNDAEAEKKRIIDFLKEVLTGKKAVIGVSGGLDSDVVARLVALAIGSENIKLFVVLQDDMEENHLKNARDLAQDLRVPLQEIDLRKFPTEFIKKLATADPQEKFRPNGLLDPSRAKCSLRTPILSTYQDRGYIVIGTSNRTEFELGFFLPFGDGIAHIKPLAHLYKTQVRQISYLVKTRKAVIDQPASAGFWQGETDLEDLAYWLFNKAPIQQERTFTDENICKVHEIKSELTTERVDQVIYAINWLNMKDETIGLNVGLSIKNIIRFRRLIDAAAEFKRRPYNVQLEPTPSQSN